MFRSTLAIAATLIGLNCTSAVAATFDATSHLIGGTPEHSLWFSGGSNPLGATGTKANHFLFENTANTENAFGTFVQDGTDIDDKATLSGTVRNAAGQGFQLMMSLIVVADPGTYKNPTGAVTSNWTFYDLDTTGTNLLTSLTAGIASYDIALRGDSLRAQFGLGANDKDSGFGFSTWISLNESGCTSNCQEYRGDLNLSLGISPTDISAVPLPAGLPLLAGGLGLLGFLMRRRRRDV